MAIPVDKMDQPDNALFDRLLSDAAKPAPPAPRPTPRPRAIKEYKIMRGDSLLDRHAPDWSLRAAREIGDLPPGQRVLVLVAALLAFAVGFVFAVGGGYWSIQGVRLVLVAAGVPIVAVGLPAAQWWAIPIGNTIIQIATRRVEALRRVLWTPSLWFDGATTGFFLSLILIGMLPGVSLLTIGAIAAMLGLLLAVVIEHILLGTLVIVVAAWRR